MSLQSLFLNGLLVLGIFLVGVLAHAYVDQSVLASIGQIRGFACEWPVLNSPLVPLVATGGIFAFSMVMIFGEKMDVLIATLVKIGLGIFILVGVPLIAGYFGLGWECGVGG